MSIISDISNLVHAKIEAALITHTAKNVVNNIVLFASDDIKDIGDEVHISIPLIQGLKSEPNGDMKERISSIECSVFILSRCSDIDEFQELLDISQTIFDIDWEAMSGDYEYETGDLNISSEHARQNIFCAVVTLEFEKK